MVYKKNIRSFFVVSLLIISVLCLLILFPGCGNNKNAKTAIKSSSTIALVNGRLIDGTGNAPIENSVIIIQDGKIKTASEYSKELIPEDADIYDAKGLTILPGFIDSHVHMAYSMSALRKWAKAGVTTVRDLCPFVSHSSYIEKRDTLNKENKNALLIAGSPMITATNGYGTNPVSSKDEAIEAVQGFIENNTDIIKFALEDNLQGRQWNMMPEEYAKAVVDTAHAKNKKVSVHISHVRNLQAAIDAGVDDIAHMVVEPLSSELINQVVENEIYWVPTLELWKGVSEMHSLNWADIASSNLSAFYKAGGKVALGTDYGGYTCAFDEGFPITEVLLMKEAGMSNMDIIIAGTKNAAYVCDIEKERGTIEPGKFADILIIEGNPLDDITVLQQTRGVIHNGEFIVSLEN